ncbi:hypothetical protein FE634_10895 [Nocardioides dongxiaopingii]|uniref:hypothetical protein n=1 Tax=Nocardioides sp. S-1144 TaxID=2582905 RepID=UPI00116360CF|nr:hypothetical protein [Nocardioides sp. S-1144]QCW50791.2 hypothetical protein FE634_10895 [Nocardioides sp. S-1144]
MTTWDAIAACRRRWYVLLAGLLVTLAVVAGLGRVDGVYAARVDVVFLAPATPAAPNRIASASSSVIAIAGQVQRMVAPGPHGGINRGATSDAVGLLGTGVDNGSAIVLPDSGGQWAHGFDRPVLSIEVTGASPADVLARTRELVARVEAVTLGLQDDPRIAADNRITTSLSPAVPQVSHHQGRRSLSMLVALLLGLSLSVVLASASDRHLNLLRRLRTRPPR